MLRVTIIVAFCLILQGCMWGKWDIKKIETTYVNQETDKEYIQKNAVLINRRTGKTWVFSSDQDSHYYWLELQNTEHKTSE